MLELVKAALVVMGNYQDVTLQVYIDEIVDFLKNAGVPKSEITIGLVADL